MALLSLPLLSLPTRYRASTPPGSDSKPPTSDSTVTTKSDSSQTQKRRSTNEK